MNTFYYREPSAKPVWRASYWFSFSLDLTLKKKISYPNKNSITFMRFFLLRILHLYHPSRFILLQCNRWGIGPPHNPTFLPHRRFCPIFLVLFFTRLFFVFLHTPFPFQCDFAHFVSPPSFCISNPHGRGAALTRSREYTRVK